VAGRTDLLGRLTDLGEEALQRLGDAPGADRALGALNALRDRLDELQKRVRGLEELEHRLTALERKVDRLAKGETGGSPAATRQRKAPTTKSSGGTPPKQQ
jgi:hypothetical protein